MDIGSDILVKSEEKLADFERFNIKIANQFYILNFKTLREMFDVSEVLFKIIRTCYNDRLLYNSDISGFEELIELPEPKITITPIRVDFLLKHTNRICVNDINIPDNFIFDMIWPELGIDSLELNFNFSGRNYAILNAFPRYKKIFSEYFKSDPTIIRYLELNSNNTLEQNQFLMNLYEKISNYNFFNLIFQDKDINNLENSIEKENTLISYLLNTNNSLESLLESATSLFKYQMPIFANPKLLPFLDKRLPDKQFINSILKSNEIGRILRHIPRKSSVKNKSVIKNRFGHSGKSWVGEINSKITQELQFRQEKLYGFKFNGNQFNGTLKNMRRFRKLNYKPNVNFRNHIYELSMNSILITKNDKVEKIIPGISFSCRGAIYHPISGPHTTIYPTIIEK